MAVQLVLLWPEGVLHQTLLRWRGGHHLGDEVMVRELILDMLLLNWSLFLT